MSPKVEDQKPLPLCASTPLVKNFRQNADDAVDSKKCDANSNNEEHAKPLNGTVSVVLESRNSVVDVLSGGESDTCDTFTRNKLNNNSIHSTLDGIGKPLRNSRRDTEDICYCVAKELLMTERTYKRDLELITVSWSCRVSELVGEGISSEIVEAFGRPCLALEQLVLKQGVFLATLERCLADLHRTETDDNEPEYKRIGDILFDYLSNSFDEYSWYICRAAGLLALVESARRACPTEAPPTVAILRPLQRPHHYMLLAQLLECGNESVTELGRICADLCAAATTQLRHVENHATLCLLQRDLTGYDKLLIPNRQFVQFGCVYKHSAKGLQQRMIFLFSDILVLASKPGLSTQFRAVSVWTLHNMKLEKANLPNSFTLLTEQMSMLLSASNEQEYLGWYNVLQDTIDNAPNGDNIDITVEHSDTVSGTNSGVSVEDGGMALAHVCWHRACSLHATHLHTLLCTELSGYLLRKFKSSHGWQKLWVVLSGCTLHFYKGWSDPSPLASLPMLGYSVGIPSEQDNITKDFVFKLQHKGHVYFFRADCKYTYNRWTDSLRKATTNSETLQKQNRTLDTLKP